MWLAPFRMPFLGFLGASFFIQGLEAVSCPLHWFLYEQHCYSLFKNKLSWNDAETECNSYGKYAHLASIHTEQEMDNISSAIRTNFEKTYRTWIGLYKIGGRRTRFRWIDEAVVEYIPWAPSEPSSNKGKCVQVDDSDYKYWSPQFCEMKQPYLCKMAVY